MIFEPERKLLNCLHGFRVQSFHHKTSRKMWYVAFDPFKETKRMDFQFCLVSLLFFQFKLSVSRMSGQSWGFLREMSRTEMAGLGWRCVVLV